MDLDITCPQCLRLDCVQSIPSLYAGGISTSYGTGTYSGVGVSAGGLVPVYGTATIERRHSTVLADSLAPEPDRLPTGRTTTVGMVLLLPSVFALLAGIAALLFASGEHMDDSIYGAMFLFYFSVGWALPGVVVLYIARGRRRRNAAITRGRPLAQRAWLSGFYCHRCGSAYWPQSPLPGLPARQVLTPQQFQWQVWNAGGYAGA